MSSRHGLLVKVKYCALSRQDLEVIQGRFLSVGVPIKDAVVGIEVFGVVEAVGKEVRDLAVGDEVVGLLPLDGSAGGCAEYCVVEDLWMVKRPERVNDVALLASLAPGIAAFTALHYLLHVVSGESLLILDAASVSSPPQRSLSPGAAGLIKKLWRFLLFY